MSKIIKVWVETKTLGSSHSRSVEVDKETWEKLSEQERHDLMLDTLYELIDWGYDEVKSE